MLTKFPYLEIVPFTTVSGKEMFAVLEHENYIDVKIVFASEEKENCELFKSSYDSI